MSATYPAQTSFNKGELSPYLASRADIDWWRTGLKLCRNFHVLQHGGLRRRSGTVFITELRDSTAVARLFPFKFSEDQAYIHVLNDGYIRFAAQRGVLGAPYEIAHPWADADLARLNGTQFNDVAYIDHKDYAPRKISRKGDTNWTIEEAVFKDGPYLDVNSTGTTLTPSDTGHITPSMTSNSAPSGAVTASDSGSNAYLLFDRKKTQNASVMSTGSGWIMYQFASGAKKVADAYWITKGSESANDMATEWEIEGSHDGTNFITLDSRSGESGWVPSETRFYNFDNDTAYEYYRWSFRGSGDTNSARIAELAIHQKAEDQTPFNLTASSATGINEDQGFQTSDVGRAIRLLGADGEWRWARITARTSATIVKIRLYGQALPNLSPITSWKLGAFSDESGWPGGVDLYSERLIHYRTDEKPTTIYGSKQGAFDDFGVSDPVVATDGLAITVLSSSMNEILWASEDQDNLFLGSAGQIRSLGPADITKAFSAVNLTQQKGPTSGAHFLKPLSVGSTALFVGKGGTDIRELLLGDQNRYVAPRLTVIAEHLFKPGIVDWAWSENPESVIYVVIADGSLVAVTYDREQKVVGFARHDVGGIVENVAVIPGVTEGYDDVYLVVRRTINGATKRYLEVLERAFDPALDTLDDAFFVDCGLKYSGPAITTLTGLDHLEGETVVALANGGAVTGLTVSSGSVTLPYAAANIAIGLPYTSRAVTLPIAGPGQDGTLFGRRKNVTSGFVDVYASGALEVGPYSNDSDFSPVLCEQLMKRGDEMFGEPIALQTGFIRCDIEGSWVESQGQVDMQTDEPFPCLIRSFVYQLEAEP